MRNPLAWIWSRIDRALELGKYGEADTDGDD